MKKIAVCLLLLLATDFGFGRYVLPWSYQQMFDQADLVVIAKPISTKDTSENGKLVSVSNFDVVGLSTEFETALVLKGDRMLKEFVLHHYRLRDETQKPGNSPDLVTFTYYLRQPDRYLGPCYLLFLRKERDGRYAPVSGQTDPAWFSVLKLPGGATMRELKPGVSP